MIRSRLGASCRAVMERARPVTGTATMKFEIALAEDCALAALTAQKQKAVGRDRRRRGRSRRWHCRHR
ncbi:hypothetical protein ASF24_17530 [Methylobacterium sp. Leaf86]|nr:hypothetical protein ASF24_17530 [Methylobacterium sp. Leaf86]